MIWGETLLQLYCTVMQSSPSTAEDFWIDARLKESSICPSIITRPLTITFSLIPCGWGLVDNSLDFNLEERVACLTLYLQRHVSACLACTLYIDPFPFIWFTYDVSYSSNARPFFCFVFGLEHYQVVPGFSFCIHITAFIKLPRQIWMTDKGWTFSHPQLLWSELLKSLWTGKMQKILLTNFK